MNNFFDEIPDSVSEEIFTTILQKDKVKIERIVSQGQISPPDFWYNQTEHEWVILLQGEAEVEFTDRKVFLRKGDFLEIPAHSKHRVTYTSTTPQAIWLAIFWS